MQDVRSIQPGLSPIKISKSDTHDTISGGFVRNRLGGTFRPLASTWMPIHVIHEGYDDTMWLSVQGRARWQQQALGMFRHTTGNAVSDVESGISCYRYGAISMSIAYRQPGLDPVFTARSPKITQGPLDQIAREQSIC